MPTRHSRRAPFANALFFPAATLYGAFVVPWWVLASAGYVAAPAGLSTPVGHAHEMLFGYAMAVVAGYLLGPQPMRTTVALLATWCLARIAFLLWPTSVLTPVSSALFAAGFAAKVVPRFAQSAKKWRNRSVVPIVTALALVATIAAALLRGPVSPTLQRILIEAVVLLAALLFFMGGRIIAPAIAGHIRRHGTALESPVQPALEGTVLICFGAIALLQPLPFAVSRVATAALLVLAGALTGIRLVRWRPWRCWRRPDLLVLLLGYGWLATGLVLTGAAMRAATPAPYASLHAITVGGLGTLTITVMGRTRLLYRYRDANHAPTSHVGAVMMSGAAIARLWPGTFGATADAPVCLEIAALLWCAACLVTLRVLLKTWTVTHRGGTRVEID